MFTLITLILRLRATANETVVPAAAVVAANDTAAVDRFARAA